MEIAAIAETLREETRRWHTWHTAALPLLKKFPESKDFIPSKAAPKLDAKPKSAEKLIAIARQWAAVTQ